jgi:RNA polymerase sigma-70 factor (ECF subfamily)
MADEADDIRDARCGDGEAYRRLVCRHQQEIARRLRRFSRDSLAIEEMVQETFVQAYFSLDRYRGEAPFEHWLHRIAVRVGYRYWKLKRHARQTTTIEGQPLASSRNHDPTDDVEKLHRVLDQLSSRDRLVVTLLYLEERSAEETAKLTGWSKTMVKVQAFRARAKLKKLMTEADKR